MTTLKRGSKGEDVKSLQNALNKLGYGLAVDGDFGAKTETAVLKFQAAKKLTVDGIVGAKTLASLGFNVPSNVPSSKCIDPSVIYKPLPTTDKNVHITKCAKRTPKYLAIHYTAGASSQPGKAEAEYNSFIKRSASADFAVDDRDMVQFNPDPEQYYCWAVGGPKLAGNGGSLYGKATNSNTVSIEICSNRKIGTNGDKANHSGWYFTEAALDNAVKLAKIIMKKYNIPLERVVRHYDITGKKCPGVIGWNNETICDTAGTKTSQKSTSADWEKFKKRLG